MPNRRDFLKTGAAAGAGALMAKGGLSRTIAGEKQQDNSYTIYAAGTPPLTKWTEGLIGAIPRATPITPNPYDPSVDYYEISMEGGRHQFHTLLPVTSLKKFTTWYYAPFAIPYLGPTIEALSGRPVIIKFINNLPDYHPVQQSLDPTIPEPEIYGVMPGGRATPHLHGGNVAPQFDGHPHSWFTKRGEHGTHYGTLGTPPGNEAIYYYSNDQQATMLWYHDHAMGQTRVNAYVGLAALYFIRDTYDSGQPDVNNVGTGLTKVPAGPFEVPLVLQDKTFNLDGSLFYPILGVTPEHPIWMPEFFGDTPVINGKCYPNFNVQPRRYRFRIVNGSQARFYNLWISKPNKGNIPLWQIGAEQSLLPLAYALPNGQLLIAPGERADIIADFTGLAPGTKLMMQNNANVPFPGGGGGPNIPELMQFTIVALAGTDSSAPPASLVLPTITPLGTTVKNRQISMKETLGPTGGGNQMAPTHVRLNSRWLDDVRPSNGTLVFDECPVPGATETWQFINSTVDEHPMHMHLVQFQVFNRQAFNVAGFDAAYAAWVATAVDGVRNATTEPLISAYVVGATLPPLGNETGWKDTVRCPAGMVTRVRATFNLPAANPLITGSGAPDPAQYVYHCHILEHEENEMMRSFLLTASGTDPGNQPRSFWKPGAEPVATLPTAFALAQNYPNPFNPSTTLRFMVPENSHVEIKVYSTLGQEVATLVDADYGAGTHQATWNAAGFASGTYFAKMRAGNFTGTQKMQLLK